jgi:putative membrane protein
VIIDERRPRCSPKLHRLAIDARSGRAPRFRAPPEARGERLVGRRLARRRARTHPSAMHSLLQPIVHVLLSGVSVFVVAHLLPGIRVKSYGSAVFFALVVGLFNAIAWHYLALLTVPFAIVTLGLGYLVVNGLLFLLASRVVKGVEISGCVTAAFASIGVSVLNWAMHFVFGHWAP